MDGIFVMRRLKEEKEMEIQFEDLVVDEENDRIILSLQTENHDFGFQKVIRLDEDTDTPQKLRKHLEGMASAIAKEHNYGEAHFDFNGCGYFYEPPEGEEEEDETEETGTYTEKELDAKPKDELTNIATDLDIYEEEMDERSYTKAKIIEKILETQE